MTPEDVLARIVARRKEAIALVRCADCRQVHYRSEPPPIPSNPWKEWLECDHGLTVELRDLEKPIRNCTRFNRRPPTNKEICR